ncbi:MAG: hypothetical protein EBR01_13605 [Proteobacteria bacterium]|nr:hypothetical protein [Pseudomonadota bacterium]
MFFVLFPLAENRFLLLFFELGLEDSPDFLLLHLCLFSTFHMCLFSRNYNYNCIKLSRNPILGQTSLFYKLGALFSFFLNVFLNFCGRTFYVFVCWLKEGSTAQPARRS